MLNWEWFTDRNVFHLFIIILLYANHEDKKWRGKTIRRGQFLTSIKSLSRITKLSVGQVRVSLNKLKTTREITIETSSLSTLISIVNWEKYQTSDTPDHKRIANEQQTDSKPIATTKNYKNEEELKNEEEGRQKFFEMFRRCTDRKLVDDQTLWREVGKFINKYPEIKPSKAGALINAWAANIGINPKSEMKISDFV